jgi:hypothetical protein
MSERAETRPSHNAYPVVATGATLVGEMSAVVAREMGKEPPHTANVPQRERFRRAQARSAAGAQHVRDALREAPNPAGMTRAQAQEYVQELARTNKISQDEQRTTSREVRHVQEFPTPESVRQEILAEVADVTRRGDTAHAFVNTPAVRGQSFGAGYLNGQFGFRSPMDSSTPGRKANPVGEGISFTPAHRNSGSKDTFVVVDYQFARGNSVVSSRIAVPPPLGNRILAATIEAPGFGRDMANTILDARGLSIGGHEATDATFADNPIGVVQVFDGITHGSMQETADAIGTNRLFLPAGTHIEYPAHVQAA